MKAFLGMGLLGSNFVQAMIKRGENVQVWNRTASKAQELEKLGAKAFTQVADAVAFALARPMDTLIENITLSSLVGNL